MSDNRAPFNLQGYNINFLDEKGEGKTPKLNLADVWDFFTRTAAGAPEDDDGDNVGVSLGGSFDAETSFDWFLNNSLPSTSSQNNVGSGSSGSPTSGSASSTGGSAPPSPSKIMRICFIQYLCIQLPL